MSHFFDVTYETHEEYLYELDTLIVVKQMQRDNIPLDPDYVLGTGSGLWILLRTLFTGVEETGDGFLIPGPFTEDQVEKLTDFCDGLFSDDYNGCGPVVEVNEEGAHFDTVSDGTFYIHSMYDDFVSLASFLKELPITEEGDEEDGSDDEDEDND